MSHATESHWNIVPSGRANDQVSHVTFPVFPGGAFGLAAFIAASRATSVASAACLACCWNPAFISAILVWSRTCIQGGEHRSSSNAESCSAGKHLKVSAWEFSGSQEHCVDCVIDGYDGTQQPGRVVLYHSNHSIATRPLLATTASPCLPVRSMRAYGRRCGCWYPLQRIQRQNLSWIFAKSQWRALRAELPRVPAAWAMTGVIGVFARAYSC